MAKIDDLLQRRAKQIVLAVVARLAHGSSLTANLAVKGIMSPASRESQNARNPTSTPDFPQVKSQRSINRFRILHGRLCKLACQRFIFLDRFIKLELVWKSNSLDAKIPMSATASTIHFT
jgi:hypothetical protein